MKLIILSLFIFSSCSSVVISSKKSNSLKEQKDYSFIKLSEDNLSYLSGTKKWKGGALCAKGDIGAGKKYLRNESVENRESAAWWNQLGNCYFYEKKFRKANYFYRLALSKKKSYIPSLNNIALIHLKRGQLQQAYLLMSEIKNLEPFSKIIKFNLAQISLQLKKVDHSQKIINELITDDQNDVNYQLLQGQVHLLKKNFKEAEEIFSKFQERDDAKLFLSSVYLNQGDYKKSLKLLQTVHFERKSSLDRVKNIIKKQVLSGINSVERKIASGEKSK